MRWIQRERERERERLRESEKVRKMNRGFKRSMIEWSDKDA